ncbi:MFS transporter [Actinorhabdospora filicis]|uniref:MFS transporter n=1 Tax=Actinorhabdospora filicis TaxID=1785913 RepID=A0A9W6W6W8_9ACTN|nr:MFS transporter [Actinorhabdospora filicis]GLZ81997.1 MFS transporter [Actinorhabdospora filicis]
MYLAATRAADGKAVTSPAAKVSGTVVALGLVSLVTDMSAEMVTAVLPMYLMYGLGLGYLSLGVLDGVYTGATAVLRLAGGYAADRLGRPKLVAAAGYGLSALTKLGLPLAGGSMTGIGLMVGADRLGKGVRTAPRDALIAAATPPGALGRAFGVHRTLDTAGALLGPLLAWALLAAVTGGYDTVFAASFCLAVAGVLALLFFVRTPPTVDVKRRAALRTAIRAVTAPGVRRIWLLAGLLGLATVGDMFLYLAIQRGMGLPPAVLPLLPLGSALTFMLAATPVGLLADRLGRWRVFVLAHLLLVGGYLALAGPVRGWPVAIGVLVLHGLFYAGSDGVLMAHAGKLLPGEVRATGMAVVQTTQALGRGAAAIGFGVLTQATALGPAFTIAAAALATAVLTAVLIGRKVPA